MDILARFLHLQVEEKQSAARRSRKETMIFPRYHQLDVRAQAARPTRAQAAPATTT